MSMQTDIQILRQCTGGAHERLVYVIPKHMARATKDLNTAWIMSQVVFWQQYNMENHGNVWVVKPAKEWQAEFGMTRREFEGAIEALIANFGLQKKVVKSPYYNNNTTLCLRFDPHILWSKLESELNCAFQNVQNEHSEMSKMNNPLFTEGLSENTKKIYAHPPKGDVRSAPDTSLEATTPLQSSSKKKAKDESQEQPPPPPSSATPPAPKTKRPPRVQVTTTPPTTHDSSHAPKPPRAPNDYQRVTGAVASVVFGIPEGETDKGVMKRVGLIAGYLWGSNKSMQAPRPANEDATQKADNIIADIKAFSVWWGRVFRDATPPRDLAKFAEHWVKFWHDSRKSSYAPAPTYEEVLWNSYSNDEDTEQG